MTTTGTGASTEPKPRDRLAIFGGCLIAGS